MNHESSSDAGLRRSLSALGLFGWVAKATLAQNPRPSNPGKRYCCTETG